MHEKLHAVQESCWGKFFRFEHTNPFIAFERKFSHRGIIRLRLDDIIYLFLLATICIVFSRLPSDTSSILAIAYNHFLFFLMAFSCVWLISPSGYRHLFFLGIAGLFPALIFLAYRKVLVRILADNCVWLDKHRHNFIWVWSFSYPLDCAVMPVYNISFEGVHSQ